MKINLASAVVTASFLFLMGMGGLGGNAPADKIPEPKKSFSVVVVDRQGVKTSLVQFSQDGKVVITGKRGSADVAVPFENISQIQFQGLEKNEIRVEISLRESKKVHIQMDQSAKFYGQAEFGTFQIEAKNLQFINFHP